MAEGEPEKSARLTLAETQYSRFREAIEGVRSKMDTAAKGVMGLAATGLGAIGIAEIGDVFPYEGPAGALVGLLAAFGAMASAAMLFAWRLWKTQEPVVMRSDPARIVGLTSKEREQVEVVFAEMARLNKRASLQAYEKAAAALEADAEKEKNAAAAKVLRERVAEMRAEILAAHARAALIVIRGRTATATRGRGTVALLVAFFLGLVGFALSADALESRRSGEIDLAKSCAEATEAGVTKLPAACDPPTPTPDPSAGKVTADALAALAEARADCLAAVERDASDPAACAPITRAIQVGVPPQ